MSMETHKFKVDNKGGPLAGKELEGEIEGFDWERFKTLPGAEQFARKHYIAECRNRIRSDAETERTDFPHTMQAALVSSLKPTSQEIKHWLDTRDWDAVGLDTDKQDRLRKIIKHPDGAPNVQRAQELIASVADKPIDLVADYLFLSIDPALRPPPIKAEDL